MHLGLSKLFFGCYKRYKLLGLSIRHILLGFEYVNRAVQYVDKRLIIPVLRKYGATIGRDCDIETPLMINTKEKYERLKIGNNCYIGKDVMLDIKGGIELQDNVTISYGATLISHVDVGASPLKDLGFDIMNQKVILEQGCYIGANAVVLHGIIVGECAVVGAGSVVAKDVLPYTVVAGVPARLVRKIERSNLL